MKKILILMLVATMIVSMSACGDGQKPAADSPGTVTVAVFMPHLDNPFMNRLNEAVKKYLTEASFEVISYAADNDAAKQASQIEAAIEEGVDAMILNPCSFEELGDAVAKAKAEGISVVTIHSSISTQDDCVSYTGPDFTNGGMQAMTQAMKDLPDGGAIGILKGAEGESAQKAISAGYPEALKGQDDKYPIVAEGYANWNAADAKAMVNDWFSKGLEFNSIVCNNDGMATGALDAVTEAGMAGDIYIYGLDAQDNILDAIKEGTVKATIYVDFDAEAKKSVDIVIAALAGDSVDSEYLLPMILITDDNVDEYRK